MSPAPSVKDEPSPEPARGAFLVLDGPDGGGKTTQVAALADWLRARGHAVTTCRDPGGTPLGDRLRALLLDRGAVRFGPRAEALLYMASRAQLVEEVVRPALARGEVVVSDRYLLANVVYQGFAGGLGVAEVGRVGLLATGGLLPDLTVVLDLPTDRARARVGRARDRMEERPADYHERVREGFLAAVAAARAGGCAYYPAPVTLVDASGAPDAVARLIRSEVERALALDPRP